jgi:small subunit ribosomal protein S9
MAEENGTVVAEEETTAPAPAPEVKPTPGGFFWGTGRRKTAVARVRIRPTADDKKSKFLINGKSVDRFFSELRDRNDVVRPLNDTKTEGKIDVLVKVHGGGYMGQAGAIKLGLARALKNYDSTLEPILRDNDLLTRDPREVERKKYGQRGARRRFQFSKR